MAAVTSSHGDNGKEDMSVEEEVVTKQRRRGEDYTAFLEEGQGVELDYRSIPVEKGLVTSNKEGASKGSGGNSLAGLTYDSSDSNDEPRPRKHSSGSDSTYLYSAEQKNLPPAKTLQAQKGRDCWWLCW